MKILQWCICVCAPVCVHMYMRARVYVFIYVYVRVSVCASVRACVQFRVCTNVCMWMHEWWQMLQNARECARKYEYVRVRPCKCDCV